MSDCADCRKPTSLACPWCQAPVCSGCFDAEGSTHRLGACIEPA